MDLPEGPLSQSSNNTASLTGVMVLGVHLIEFCVRCFYKPQQDQLIPQSCQHLWVYWVIMSLKKNSFHTNTHFSCKIVQTSEVFEKCSCLKEGTMLGRLGHTSLLPLLAPIRNPVAPGGRLKGTSPRPCQGAGSSAQSDGCPLADSSACV